ncbi:MAG: FAD-dependent oxidoreductase [Rhodobacterales bacterium]|nr:MAG: FAD-dependent oxidoreductase [Rhodobacterales bacterium]
MKALFANDDPGCYPPSWYAQTATPLPPAPPLQGATRTDVCIVGAGYAGLTAALELRARGFDVTVLEAHRAGFGASGRNGGQVGSGFNRGQQELERTMGEGPARALWDLAEEAKALTRAQVARHAPEARLRDGGAHGAYGPREAQALAQEAEHLSRRYGYEQITAFDAPGFEQIVRSPRYRGGIVDQGAAHLHPLRYVLGLARAAKAAGVHLFENSAVHRLTEGPELHTAHGSVRADHVILAGNGYLPDLARGVSARSMPINSFIGATEPLPDPRAVLTRDIAVADSKFVVNYFRLSEDNRLLFGGRESYSALFPKDIATRLHARMVALFPQLGAARFSHVWGGTLSITRSRLPLVMRVDRDVLSVGGFSGHGVALSALSGKIAAEAIAGQSERFDLMASLPTPRFPGGSALRAPLLTAAMTWYAMRDRLGV